MIRRSSVLMPLGAVLVGLGLVGVGAPKAQAGILPTLIGITPNSGSYQYQYSVFVPPIETVKAGDSFTLYDFGGYVPSTVGISGSVGNWNVSVANVTPPPAGVSPTDNPSIPNLTFTYAPTTPGQTVTNAGFTFWANSTFNLSFTPPPFNFASSVHSTASGVLENSVTTVTVPSSQSPEPATLALVGIGAPLLGAFQFFRRRRAARIG